MCAVFGNIFITYFADGANQSGSQSIILFIRFTHFNAMFYPIRYYIRHYTMYNKKRESQIIQIFQTFVLMIFLSHILASYLIVLGDGEGEPGEPRPWIKENQGNFETLPEGEEINTTEHIAKLYIFAFYWIWTVITMVGYGDRSITMDYGDVLFTLLVEFIGLIMQAILINVMANFVEGNNTFAALVNSKLEPLQLWI